MPRKALAGDVENIVPCIACNQGCLANPFGEKASSCVMNPSMGREREAEILPAEKPKRVLLVGGGGLGCEAADFLAEPGENPSVPRTSVTIVEMLRRVAQDMPIQSRHLLMERLRNRGFRIITQAKVKEIREDGVLFVRDGREETMRNADCIVLALGSEPVDNLSGAIADRISEIHVIGDARGFAGTTPAQYLTIYEVDCDDPEQAGKILARYQRDPNAWPHRLPPNGSLKIAGAGWYRFDRAFHTRG